MKSMVIFLKVVSSDGLRISLRRIELKNTYPDKKVIVPGKTLNEISKILSGDADKDVNLFLLTNISYLSLTIQL